MSQNNRTISHSNKELENLIIKLWELSQNTVASFNELKSKSNELYNRNSKLEQLVGEKDHGTSRLLEDKALLEQFAREQELKLESSAEEIHALKSQIENVKSELEAAQTKAAEYQDAEGRMTLLRERLERQENLLDEFEMEKSRSAELNKKVIELTKSLSNFEQLEQDLDLAHKEISRKNLDLVERNHGMDNLREKSAEYESQLIRLRSFEKKYDDLLSQSESNSSEIDAKNTLIRQLETEIKELKSANEFSKNFIEELQGLQDEIISEITEENDSLKIEKSSQAEKIASIESELFILKQSFIDSEKNAEDLGNALKIRDSQIVELEEYRESYNFLKLRLVELESSDERNRMIISNLERDIAVKDSEMISIKEDRANLSIRAEKLNSKYVSIINQHESFKRSFDLLSQERTNLILENEDKNRKIDDLNNQISRLSLQLNEADSTIDELNKKAGELILANIRLAESEKTGQQNVELQSKLEELQSKIENLHQSLLLAESKSVSSEDEVRRLREKLLDFDIIKSELVKLQADALNYKKSVEILKSKINEFTKQSFEDKFKIEALNKSLIDEAAAINAGMESEFLVKQSALTAEIVQLQADAQNYNKSVEILKSKESDYRRQLFENNYKIDALQNEIAEKSFELSVLRSALSETSSERDAVARSRDSIAAISVGKDALIDDFKRRIVELLASLNTAKEEVFNRESKINELKQIISKLSEESIDKEMELKKTEEKYALLSSELEKSKVYEAPQTLVDTEKYLVREDELETQIISLNKSLTNKENQLSQLLQRTESLESLLKSRYEHIKILESQIDELGRNHLQKVGADEKHKLELLKKAEFFLGKINKALGD